MKRSKGSLVLILGLPVLAFFLLWMLLSQVRGTQGVLVATKAIQPGVRIDKSLVAIKQVPAGAVLPNAFRKVEDALGQSVAVARMPGDQVTQDMVGPQALSEVALALPADHRAVAVKVDRAGGLGGLLQRGDTVSVIGIINPRDMGLSGDFQVPETETVASGPTPTSRATPSAGATPAAGSQPTPAATEQAHTEPSTQAMVVLSNLRVLLVPQTFRYIEAMPGEQNAFLPVQASQRQQESGVVLLDVPLKPQPLYPGGPEVSPPEILALLNAAGQVHLALEPPTADYSIPPHGASLIQLYKGLIPKSTATPTGQAQNP